MRLLPVCFGGSTLLDSAIVLLPPRPRAADKPLQQGVLGCGELLVVDIPGCVLGLQLHQLLADRSLVVELGFGLLLDALGQPGRAAYGGERKGQQSGDQAHAVLAGTSWSAKL